MEKAEQEGLEIARSGEITPFDDDEWLVPELPGANRFIRVRFMDPAYCPCQDFKGGKDERWCKHFWAIFIMIDWQVAEIDGYTSEYPQEHDGRPKILTHQSSPANRKARINEKDDFKRLLSDLCRNLPISEPGVQGGRPPLPLPDLVFSTCLAVYVKSPPDLAMCDIRQAQRDGQISKVPSPNSIHNFLSHPDTSEILKDLIRTAALPLQVLESECFVDSTNFPIRRSMPNAKQKSGKLRDWIRVQCVVARNTNVVLNLQVVPSTAHDSPGFIDFFEATKEYFRMRGIAGDSAYASIKNLEALSASGIIAVIPLRKNALGDRGGAWGRMYNWMKSRPKDFYFQYYKRNNIETAFSMVKEKFGPVRARTDPATHNEIFARFLCHNICCVIQSIYEFGIQAEYFDEHEDEDDDDEG